MLRIAGQAWCEVRLGLVTVRTCIMYTSVLVGTPQGGLLLTASYVALYIARLSWKHVIEV